MQCVQNPCQSNVNNLNNVRREASRHFRNKEKKYVKTKIGELENKTLRTRISDTCVGTSLTLKRVVTSIVKNEKGNLFLDSLSSLARWRNHFSQL